MYYFIISKKNKNKTFLICCLSTFQILVLSYFCLIKEVKSLLLLFPEYFCYTSLRRPPTLLYLPLTIAEPAGCNAAVCLRFRSSSDNDKVFITNVRRSEKKRKKRNGPIDFLPSAVRRSRLIAGLQGFSVHALYLLLAAAGSCVQVALTGLINNNVTPPCHSVLAFLYAQAPLRSQFGSPTRSLPCRDSQNGGAE